MKLIDSNYSNYYNQPDTAHVKLFSDREINYDLYGTHLLVPGKTQIIQGVSLAEDWMALVFLLIMVCCVWIRAFHYKRLRNVIQAFFSHLYAVHIIRENDNLMKQVARVLNVVFILIFALFLYQLNVFYNMGFTTLNNIAFFTTICLFIFFIYKFKTWVFGGLGQVLSKKEFTDEYIFNVNLANQLMGLLLIPIVIALAYMSVGKEILIGIGFAIVGLVYLFRLGRGLRIGYAKAKLSYFYLFLYLCTLEILPLAVLVRVFIDNV